MFAKYAARKLIRFQQTGGPHVLRIDEVPPSEPGENEVVVRVRAMGLSRIDVLWREDGYVEDPVFPAKIGYDAAALSKPSELRLLASTSATGSPLSRQSRCSITARTATPSSTPTTLCYFIRGI